MIIFFRTEKHEKGVTKATPEKPVAVVEKKGKDKTLG